jgi:ABC-type glycerol-3-phosphate transport system substrate-binding protein
MMMKQLLAVLVGLMVLALTNCNKNDSVAESGPMSSGDGGVIFQNLRFTWYKNYDWYSAEQWANEKSGEKWIQSTHGVNIQFLDSGGAPDQKLATMILDDEFPDVISLERDANLRTLIEAGVILPLDGYLDKYSNLKKYLGDGILNMMRAQDGKLYSFPNWAAPLGQLSGNAGWLLQKKYHDTLGNPQLNTYDELYEYLKTLKARYPNIVPLEVGRDFQTEAVRALYGGFGANLNPAYSVSNLYRDGNTLKSVLEDPHYREMLLFVNKLYRERLITQDMFTITDDIVKERIRNGLVGIACLSDIFDTENVIIPDMELKAEDSSYGLYPMDPVRLAGIPLESVYTNFTNCGGWNVSVITKDAADPEKIFAFLDWMFGNEGQLVLVYGVPGKYFIPGEYDDFGYPLKMTDAFFSATNEEIDSEWSETNWVGNTAFVDNMAKYIYDTTGYAQQLKLDQFNYTWNHSVDSTELTDIIPPLDTDIGVLFQYIDSIYQQAVPAIITASSGERAQTAIERYLTELKSADLDRLLAWQWEVISSNLTKLGK